MISEFHKKSDYDFKIRINSSKLKNLFELYSKIIIVNLTKIPIQCQIKFCVLFEIYLIEKKGGQTPEIKGRSFKTSTYLNLSWNLRILSR